MELTQAQVELIAERIGHKVETRMETFIASQKTLCEAHHSKTAEHHKTLFGNGQPGLKDSVTKLNTKMNIIAILGTLTMSAVVGYIVKMILEGA